MRYSKTFALYERSYNLGHYQSVKLSTSLSAEIEEGDDPLEAQHELLMRCASTVETYANDEGFSSHVPQPQPGRYGIPIKRTDYIAGRPVGNAYDV